MPAAKPTTPPGLLARQRPHVGSDPNTPWRTRPLQSRARARTPATLSAEMRRGFAGFSGDSAPPPPPAPHLHQLRSDGMRYPPPFNETMHPAAVVHGRGMRTARMPSPANSLSSWERTAMILSPATMAKVEKAHVFLQRRWDARQQNPELHMQNSRAAFKRKLTRPPNVSAPSLLGKS